MALRNIIEQSKEALSTTKATLGKAKGKAALYAAAAPLLLAPATDAPAQDATGPPVDSTSITHVEDTTGIASDDEAMSYSKVLEENEQEETSESVSAIHLGVESKLSNGYVVDGLNYALDGKSVNSQVNIIGTGQVLGGNLAGIISRNDEYSPSHDNIDTGAIIAYARPLTNNVSANASLAGFQLGEVFGGNNTALGSAELQYDADLATVSAKVIQGLHNMDGTRGVFRVGTQQNIGGLPVEGSVALGGSNNFPEGYTVDFAELDVIGSIPVSFPIEGSVLSVGAQYNQSFSQENPLIKDGLKGEVGLYVPLN